MGIRAVAVHASSISFALPPVLETARLRLRPWREDDLAPFAAMSADPDVMRWFEAPLSAAEATAYVADLQDRFRAWGFGYWAVETEALPFIGFVGLGRPKIDAAFTPCVEIGWRLTRTAWGMGYASEAALRVLDHGFGLDDDGVGGGPIGEIVAMASRGNTASLRVMEKLGMTRNPADDFTYPGLAESHPETADMVLYRLGRKAQELQE